MIRCYHITSLFLHITFYPSIEYSPKLHVHVVQPTHQRLQGFLDPLALHQSRVQRLAPLADLVGAFVVAIRQLFGRPNDSIPLSCVKITIERSHESQRRLSTLLEEAALRHHFVVQGLRLVELILDALWISTNGLLHKTLDLDFDLLEPFRGLLDCFAVVPLFATNTSYL